MATYWHTAKLGSDIFLKVVCRVGLAVMQQLRNCTSLHRFEPFPHPRHVVAATELPATAVETADRLEAQAAMGIQTGGSDVRVWVRDGGDAGIQLPHPLLAEEFLEACVQAPRQAPPMVLGMDIDRSLGTMPEAGTIVKGMGINIGHRDGRVVVDSHKVGEMGCNGCHAPGKLPGIGGNVLERYRGMPHVGGINLAECRGIVPTGRTDSIGHRDI